MPKLFIGPWIGEFGVELLRWQGLARMLARDQKWDEIIVATRPDKFYLYHDFATKLVPYSPPSMHAIGFSCDGHVPPDIHLSYIDPSKGDVLFSPNLALREKRLVYGLSACRSEFLNFSEGASDISPSYDLLIHARATPKAGQHFKNWPAENYDALVQALPPSWRVASVGSLDGAHKISGTDDLRGISLEKLAGYCRQARLIVGPSSGAIHYAMHCGLAAVTWIGQEERCNYYSQWNPFGVSFSCVSGWQPSPRVILHKIHEVIGLIESKALPIEYVVVGTKRSGHHGVTEWLASLDDTTRYVQWNDCVNRHFESLPHENFFLPSVDCAPKEIHKNSHNKTVFEWNAGGRRRARILSFEGLAIEKISLVNEVSKAKHLIFVLRDAVNLAASLKKGIPSLKSKRFISPEMRSIISTYKGYLAEAIGNTHHLAGVRAKVLFISYNRWHADPRYRREIARKLGKTGPLRERSKVASHAHGSGFQSSATNANDLKTLDRWQEYMTDAEMWNVAADHDLYMGESIFHGGFSPLSLPPPI